MSKTMTWEEYSDELKIRLDDKTAELAKVKQQLAIAVEALEKTKNRLLSINIAYLSYNDRNKLYDTMLSDGIIDKALQQIKELDK